MKTLWEKKKMLVNSIFFFSHNVFQSLLLLESLEVGIVWQRVNTQSQLLTNRRKWAFTDIVGKRDNAGKHHIFLFQ